MIDVWNGECRIHHELSSGSLLKVSLFDLDKSAKIFLRNTANIPENVATPFFMQVETSVVWR